MKINFYSWLKAKTEKNPSNETDRRILAYSKQHFSTEAKSKNYFSLNWKMSGVVAFASVVLLIVLVNREKAPQTSSMLISESPEMILNYNDMELMAAASNLSEAEWAHINGNN